MTRANESAPAAGRSQRHVNSSSAKPNGLPSRPPVAGIQRLAVTPPEAARMFGVSEDYFTEHIRPELRWVRRGRKAIVAVAELERWLDASAARTLEEHG